jgi:hypothetical protein
MISAELQGKIGNLMFQIAAIESMGHTSGLQTVYPNVDKNIDDLEKPQACSSYFKGREYFKIFKNFDWHKNIDGDTHSDRTINVPFGYTAITPQDYTKYRGYFQSELYFPDREFILRLFEPADFIVERLEKYKEMVGYNKAAIHVRREDYIKLNHVYNVLGMEYYNEAMKILKLCGVTEYLVFSNDKQWCEENFIGDQFTFINDDSLVELFLIGMCAHQIIANSAFSWWGAWLNNKPGRQIIAPKIWFTPTSPNNGKDIIPLSWIKT